MDVDRSLIESCIEGDRRAQNELYGACFAQLITVCYRFANNKDDAAVLMNLAFFRILENLHKLKKDVPFMAWAIRLTVNNCISEYRKDVTRKKHISPVSFEENERHIELRLLEDKEEEYDPIVLKRVRAEILKLPPTTQEVFQLYVFQDCTHIEIAELLRIKEGTSKWHLFNARNMLREVLGDSVKTLISMAV